MMKLCKNTRDMIALGTHLTQKGMELVVTNIIESGRGKQVTAKILKHNDSIWVGRLIYAQPLSWYYGMEIK